MTFIIRRYQQFFKVSRVLYVFSLIYFISLTNALAQEMEDYRWTNRLIIVLTDDLKQQNYVDQLTELKKNSQGLIERKLLVFCSTPKVYTKEGLSNSEWMSSKKIYRQYKKSDTPFEVILIGLDGGVKARRTKVFKSESLFAMIDGMPMRRAEIKNNEK